jgi:proteasome lid subunit RPN8/RPN11
VIRCGTRPGALALRFAPRACRAALEDHVRGQQPREACGVLLGRIEAGVAVIGRVWPAANVHRFPLRAFEVDPGAIVAAARAATESLGVIGFFHSHVGGSAVLSAADRAGTWPGVLSVVAAIDARGRVALAAFRSGCGARARFPGA